MEKFEIEMIDWLINDIEGGVADLSNDSGGWTYKGLSSRYYPEIKEMYESGSLTDAHIRRVYYTDYIRTIPGYDRLRVRAPWLVKLLFPAKVHGSGDEHITVVIQQFLRRDANVMVIADGIFGRNTSDAVLALSDKQILDLRNTILDARVSLTERRIQSVGAYSNGIRNRVNKEFEFAFSAPVTSSIQGSTSSDAVIAYAKLSSVSSSPVTTRGVQVVESHGWEQLPLGMDIIIEVRGNNHASNTIVTPAEVRQA